VSRRSGWECGECGAWWPNAIPTCIDCLTRDRDGAVSALAEMSRKHDRVVAERDGLLSQRWSNQNRAEVAERGHQAASARDFEQREQIKGLRAAIEHVVNDSPGTPDSVKRYLREALSTFNGRSRREA
jgi:hypothetical protein